MKTTKNLIIKCLEYIEIIESLYNKIDNLRNNQKELQRKYNTLMNMYQEKNDECFKLRAQKRDIVSPKIQQKTKIKTHKYI